DAGGLLQVPAGHGRRNQNGLQSSGFVTVRQLLLLPAGSLSCIPPCILNPDLTGTVSLVIHTVSIIQ
ncbi:hypothetical protein, partial [Akkermansia sp.]|uniref:hypothetical protein n=1 Tax=Akkermansia sp. TaxID=1872421 RepID=UPI0025BB5A9C